MNNHRRYIVVFLCVVGCNASTYYPRREFMNLSKPSTEPELVEVLMEEGQTPSCPYNDMGTIVYDWARDGVFTTEHRALEGIREKAAEIGASGIYKLQSTTGAIVGQGVGTAVGPTAYGVVSVGSEVGLKAVAYTCISPSPRQQIVP